MDIHLDWTAVGVLIVLVGQLIGFIIWLTNLNNQIAFLKDTLEGMRKTIHQLETVYSKKEELTLIRFQVEGLGKRVDELRSKSDNR